MCVCMGRVIVSTFQQKLKGLISIGLSASLSLCTHSNVVEYVKGEG